MAESGEVEIMPGVFFTPKQACQTAIQSTSTSVATIQREEMMAVVRSSLDDVLSIATAASSERDVEASKVLKAEIARLENTIGHLERSNDEMKEYLATDPTLVEDIDSNRVIVLQQQLRICALNQLVKGKTVEEAMASVAQILDRCIEQREAGTLTDTPVDDTAMWL
jgi:hypothetical protein